MGRATATPGARRAPDGLALLRRPLSEEELDSALAGVQLEVPTVAASPRPLVLLGFDAVGWESFSPFLQQGRLPHIARMRDKGAWGPLSSVEGYPSSAAAWTACMSGLNPGKSGVLSYEVQERNSYRRRVLRPADRSGVPVWRVLDDGKRTLLVMGVPTYPAEPVNGVTVSGVFTESGLEAHPPSLVPVLRSLGLDIDPLLGILNEERLPERERFDLALEQFRRQGRLAHRLLRRFGFDVAVCVFVATDRLLSRYLSDLDRRYLICQVVDEIVGGFLAAVGDRGVLMVVSDHGLRQYRRNFNIFRWLHDEGHYNQSASRESRLVEARSLRGLAHSGLQYHLWRLLRRLPGRDRGLLRLLPIPGFLKLPRGPRVDTTVWSKTRAYPFPSWRFPVGLIRLNLVGREPQGTVARSEREVLLAEIAKRLLDLRDPFTDAQPVVWVKRREELFPGPRAEEFADLFYGMSPPYCANNRLDFTGPAFYDEAELRYCHSHEGILLMRGPGIVAGRVLGARILDVAPTVLHLCGVPKDDYLDGETIVDAFTPEYLLENPPRTRATDYEQIVRAQVRDLQDRDDGYIREQLRKMGYL